MVNSTQAETEDLRVVRTRKLIEEAFLDLLEVNTLATITVGQIAKRAMINRGTFYDHFMDKYALFDHIIRKTFLELLVAQGIASCVLDDENIGRLIAATADFFVHLNAQCPPAERQFRPIAEGQVQRVLYEVFCDALPPCAERQVVASYLSWAIFGACLQQIGNGEADDAEQVVVSLGELTRTVLQSCHMEGARLG